MKWEILIVDAQGEADDEQKKLAPEGEQEWKPFAVVPMDLCRRVYFRRPKQKIPEPPATSTDTSEEVSIEDMICPNGRLKP